MRMKGLLLIEQHPSLLQYDALRVSIGQPPIIRKELTGIARNFFNFGFVLGKVLLFRFNMPEFLDIKPEIRPSTFDNFSYKHGSIINNVVWLYGMGTLEVWNKNVSHSVAH